MDKFVKRDTLLPLVPLDLSNQNPVQNKVTFPPLEEPKPI